MSSDEATAADRIDVDRWSDRASRETLEVVAASLAELVGFEVVVINSVVADRMATVAVAGAADVRAELMGMTVPLDQVLGDHAVGDVWGRFHFVPHDRVETPVGDRLGWVPDIQPLDVPDAWHPMDLLEAELYDERGRLIGVLGVDLPDDRRRPGPERRELLQRHVPLVERVLRLAVDQDGLRQRARLAAMAHDVVRVATSSRDDLEPLLEACREAVRTGLRADGLELGLFPGAVADPGDARSDPDVPEHVVIAFRAAVQQCWREQRVAVIGHGLHDPAFDPGLRDALLTHGRSAPDVVAMIVPIGSGQEASGFMALGRRSGRTRPWTSDERDAALSLARDIGRAVLDIRTVVREERLVDRLHDLAGFKTELLATVAHELRRSQQAGGELVAALGEGHGLPDAARLALDGAARSVARTSRLADDLDTLARLEDPSAAASGYAVDLVGCVREAVARHAGAVESTGTDLRLDLPHHPVRVRGDAADLTRVVDELVDNALTYGRPGGLLAVRLRREDGHTVVEVEDDGPGLAPADRDRVFTEFNRSSNPRSIARPGLGLGLTIAARIAALHGGRLDVAPRPAGGSVFTLRLATYDAGVGG